MVRTIIKREILHNLYSLRFILSLSLVLGAFVAGSLSAVRNQESARIRTAEIQAQETKALQDDARNATALAVNRRTYGLPARPGAFIFEAKEKYLPNTIRFNAWNVFSFENRSGSANPFLIRSDELNWTMIVGLILSFVTLLFTFDAVSGEKETKTLALTLSNPVSRSALLWGKYVSAVVSVLLILLPGVVVSLLILLFAGATDWTGRLAAETAGFMVAAVVLIATLAAFGLLCSVIARNSNLSLLLALSVWLFFVVVIPNSSGFVAKTFFPLERSEAVQVRLSIALGALMRAAPEGSMMMNTGNPFLPQHELRADLLRKRLATEKAIRDDYYQAMFRQFERTRRFAAVSPTISFEYITEAVVGGGYPRFRKAWNDLHAYQGQFLEFFMALDARDPKSPHWVNPLENISTTRLPVAFETVPRFVEKPMTLADRARPALLFLLVIGVMAAVAYLLSYFLFVRYDAR
jgi:ABC-type transport system involved in multi-copper enzyme maturation permease subunit